MKKRPDGFLSEKNISHTSEIFDYVQELHDYLWKFVRLANPGASGLLHDNVDKALAVIRAAKQSVQADGSNAWQDVLFSCGICGKPWRECSCLRRR